MKVTVNDEANGRQIILTLTTEQFTRARVDSDYLKQLILNYDSNATAEVEAQEPNASEIESLNPIIPEDQVPGPSERSLFIWNEQCIYLLLTLYEEYKEEFDRKRHKVVYDLIAQRMQQTNVRYKITGSQCHSKIISLKKHFKKIVDHNSTSGNDRASWPYFEKMNELFGSTGWANPIALASEMGPEQNTSLNQEPKKRKLDFVIDEYRKDLKKYRDERMKAQQENFNKLMEQKERQHKEKLDLLMTLFNNNRPE